jgi:hypothetical protein
MPVVNKGVSSLREKEKKIFMRKHLLRSKTSMYHHKLKNEKDSKVPETRINVLKNAVTR